MQKKFPRISPFHNLIPLFFLFSLNSCAPVGLVETTANVMDEMSAFKQARRENTRESWESFIRRYPDSHKAKLVRQWVERIPNQSASVSRVQELLR